MRRLTMWALSLVAASGCSSNQQPCALENVTGSLPGVTITVRGADCVLDRGQAATFTYEVTTDARVPAIHLGGSMGSCGDCQAPNTDPASWIRWSIGGTSTLGAPMNYCLCDTGCCAPDDDRTVQPAIGTRTGTIEWSGRTWSGPSDTGQPQGDFFEPGRYEVIVTFQGQTAGGVTVRLPIEVQ